jgi:hypothetical protein
MMFPDMHSDLHIVTDTERIVDPDGREFESLAFAVGEAHRCARPDGGRFAAKPAFAPELARSGSPKSMITSWLR